ncbi:MAG: DegT/DnrJ/EryC1/StrS family aminotransferase [Planctomycetota bacterium]
MSTQTSASTDVGTVPSLRMVVPFVDLKIQADLIADEIEGAIADVFAQGRFILTEEVSAFEAEFASYCGVKHAVSVNSGFDALVLALRALGVGPGDEVITVANSFFATAAAISQAGATPIFVDCEPDSLAIDPRLVEAAITGRTKAILPVHLFGRLAEMRSLLTVAKKHGLKVVEDAAQAHGAEDLERSAGTFGDAGCFSFYPTKNLGAYGDGGAIVTDDDGLAATMRSLRNYGECEKYHHHLLGINSRLDALQAAILRVKLPRMFGWTEARRRIAARYRERLTGLPLKIKAEPRSWEDPCDHVFHLFVIELDHRDEVRAALAAAGIQTGVHYPVPIPLQPAYHSLGIEKGSYPISERAADRILSLPMFPELTDEQIDYVVEVLARVLTGRS